MNLRRKRIPDSTDIRIVKTDGTDVGQIKDGIIVYPGDEGLKVVQAVNACERMERELEEAQKELEMFRAVPAQLKAIKLSTISRNSAFLFTHVRLDDFDLQGVLKGNWLEFGEGLLRNEDRTCFLGGRMAGGVLDFEHDTPYVVRVGLVGLTYKFTEHHVSYFDAHITPDIDDIRIYLEDFDPRKVKGSWACKECKGENKHWTLPDGCFTPPVYELARVVAGKRVSITMGPRWDVLEGREW